MEKAVLVKRLCPDWGVALVCDHLAELETVRGQKGENYSLSQNIQPKEHMDLALATGSRWFQELRCLYSKTSTKCLHQPLGMQDRGQNLNNLAIFQIKVHITHSIILEK